MLRTLHDAIDDVSWVLLHLPQHHEMRHDGVPHEGQEQEEDQVQNDESGLDTQTTSDQLGEADKGNND